VIGSSNARVDAAAKRLFDAAITRRPIATLTSDWSDMTEADAYAVQDATARIQTEREVGYKLGYTSAAMRAQMKVGTPNYGRLFAHMRVSDDEALLPFDDLIHPLVEPEFALVVGRDLTSPPYTAKTISPSVDAVMPAIEIVDTRYVEYDFLSNDNIADNSSAARFVLGAPRTLAALGDLRSIAVSLWSNGATLGRGSGADVYGDPLLALAWAAQRLSERGAVLRAGDIIMTGGATKAFRVARGDAFVADFGALGFAKLFFS